MAKTFRVVDLRTKEEEPGPRARLVNLADNSLTPLTEWVPVRDNRLLFMVGHFTQQGPVIVDGIEITDGQRDQRMWLPERSVWEGRETFAVTLTGSWP